MNFRDRVLNAVALRQGSHLISVVAQFVAQIFLVRLLSPREFGLVATAQIFIAFFTRFQTLGYGHALIQRAELEQRHMDTAFAVQALFGFGAAALFVPLGPVLASRFGEPELAVLVGLLGLPLAIVPFANIHGQLMRRDLDLRAVAMTAVVAQITSSVLAVLAAFMGAGVYALVVREISLHGIRAVMLVMASPHRVRIRIDWEAGREMFGFSRDVTLTSLFSFIAMKVDDLIIVALLGTEALGIYSRAYAFMLMPLRQVTEVLSTVVYPALSRIQDDAERVKRVFLRGVSASGFITLPMSIGLLVVAEPFVQGLLGSQWSALTPVLQVLCVAGAVQSVETSSMIFLARGVTREMVYLDLAKAIATLIAVFIGVQWGVLGVAIAVTLRILLTSYISFALPGRLIGMSYWDVLRSLRGVAFLTAGMAAVVSLADQSFAMEFEQRTRLALLVMLGVLTYTAAFLATRVDPYQDVRALLQNMRKPSSDNDAQLG